MTRPGAADLRDNHMNTLSTTRDLPITRDLPVTGAVRADAKAVVDKVQDRSMKIVTILLDDGEQVHVPSHLARLIVDIVESAAIGANLATTSLPDELTTTVAADILGVSRPTLMKMISRGEVPSKKVGSHTRLLREDVLRFRRARLEKRAVSVTALMDAGDGFG